MFKLLRKPLIFRLITWSMLGPFLIMTSGCNYFRVHSSEKPYPQVIQRMQDEQKFIILHLDDKAWHFTDIRTDENNITGTISLLTDHEMYKTATPDKPIRYRTAKTNDQSEVLNEVHVYASELEVTDQVKASVPSGAITKVEVYSKARGATITSYIWVSLGILGAAYSVLIIIALLTSCPFVYIDNGNGYTFAGEIFSGAIQPGLERDDYLPLPLITPADDTFRIKVTNELKEKQYINLTELIFVDHGNNISALMDKYGSAYSITEPVTPASAMAGGNADILKLINTKDSLSYTGLEGETGENGINSLVLTFAKPDEAASGRLLLKAKNSLWMETVSGKIHELFGERYNTFSEKREKVSGDRLQKWQLDQKLPLSVYIEKNNRWEFAEYFNIAGPAAMRDDILSLDLEGIKSDTVKIKLETGFMFWEIDYAAMDFSRQEQVIVTKVPITKAIANDDTEIKDVLASSDNSYYVLDEQGDKVILVFDYPELKDDCRSAFMHTRGYYKILRDQTGPPDKKALKSFRKPGKIPVYSKDLYNGLR